MGKVRNVLFIMCDQLRADYLSCMGHPTLDTPHIDALAARGVRFTRAFTQSSVCGPSRMSFYTGRYMVTHGANWNRVPLPLHIRTMGDHLRTLGARVALAGKTHMQIDEPGLDRLGIDRTSPHGVLATQAGFEPFDRDDGLHPGGYGAKDFAYDRYLKAQGYESDNPWQDYCASALDAGGNVVSGWEMRHAGLPARVEEVHSETAYMTRRAQDFMEECGDGQPWCLHLSYIKPHWPYLAPAPYHDMYGPGDILPAVRSARERQTSHPVYAAFQQHVDSPNFSRDEVRETVIPTYMGLVRQIDDHLGKLFGWMERAGRMDDTMIVLTSDHGDYLGDHWLGEKELFHDCVLRLPMIVYDPDPAADA
ncbi:MAG: sulfatase-like hydrolase/transferase, partial [Rhodospirillaceae bacterium]|nr:sulfatase-like hydrolase/transferase [Rhodospirillaceae bacterium]